MPPGSLQAMPTVDRGLAEMKVADSVQTRARQYTAVADLGHILWVLTYDHEFTTGLTLEEGRLRRGYLDAENQLRSGSGLVPGLTALIDRYSGENAPFRSELLDRYFPPAWKTAFLTLDAQFHQYLQDIEERGRAREAANAPRAAAPLGAANAPRAAAPATPVATTGWTLVWSASGNPVTAFAATPRGLFARVTNQLLGSTDSGASWELQTTEWNIGEGLMIALGRDLVMTGAFRQLLIGSGASGDWRLVTAP
jgi:hypothetical protein